MGVEAELADEIRTELETELEIVEPEALPKSICRDKDDDRVLATALTGRAAIIVSGDKDLLVLKRFRGIKIFSPRQFVQWMDSQR